MGKGKGQDQRLHHLSSRRSSKQWLHGPAEPGLQQLRPEIFGIPFRPANPGRRELSGLRTVLSGLRRLRGLGLLRTFHIYIFLVHLGLLVLAVTSTSMAWVCIENVQICDFDKILNRK